MSKPTITIIDQGKEPTLKEMQDIVGGSIEIAYDDGKTQIICHEEGKLLGLPNNDEATRIWADLSGNIPFDVLVGNVLILKDEAILK